MLTDVRQGLICLVTVGLLLGPQASRAEERVRADRGRLTFRDAGLYCDLDFIHGKDPADEGSTNMLPPDRAVRPETPWSFYIIQGNRSTPSAERVALLESMARNGKKVILRAKVGRLHKEPDVDAMEQWLVTFFERVDPAWLYAVTLDEEQIEWNGWAEALTKLYYRVKARWPDLPVYQWWTPMEAIDVRATSGWVALPSDGWMIDLYGEQREKFERKLVKFLEAGKPVVHIAWASPTWLRWSGADTWEGGQKIMFDQIAVCRAYDVPVAYFCTQPEEEDDTGKKIAGIRWGWHAKDPVVRSFYRALEAKIMNFRHVPAASIGYRSQDAAKFDWARSPDVPEGVSYQLDAQQRIAAAVSCDLRTVPLEPGTHRVGTPAARPRIDVKCVLEDSVRLLQGGFRVRSVKDRGAKVPVVFRIDPEHPIALQTVAAQVTTVHDLGGSANIAWSKDGRSWSQPVKSDPSLHGQWLTVPFKDDAWSSDPVWIRIELVGDAFVPTNVCSSLANLRVTAAIEELP